MITHITTINLISNVTTSFRYSYLSIYMFISKPNVFGIVDFIIVSTVKPVSSSHQREAQKMAALGKWLLDRGAYQYTIKV